VLIVHLSLVVNQVLEKVPPLDSVKCRPFLLAADAWRLRPSARTAEQGIDSVNEEVPRRTSGNVQHPCGNSHIFSDCLERLVCEM